MNVVPSDTSPLELLGLARGLLAAGATASTGVWPRASALLARQALELGVTELWHDWGHEMERVSARAQLLCFEAYVGDSPLAEDVRHAWWALSRASHHQPFELAPTAGELHRWFDVVERLVGRIAATETATVRKVSTDALFQR